MKRKLNWGILGCASIAKRAFIPAIIESKLGVPYGIASREMKRTLAFQKEFKIPKAYPDYQSLLDDPAIDVVYIPLANHLHCEWTCKAAKAGKHILVDKPIALNLSELKKMITATDRQELHLVEGFMYRFHPQIEKVLNLIQEGTIGETRTFKSSFTFMYPPVAGHFHWTPKMGGGALYDVGCYTINSARLIFGTEPVLVYAKAHLHPKYKVDASTSVILEFPGGKTALVDCSFESQFQSYFEVVGTDGKIIVPRAFSQKQFDVPVIVVKEDDVKTITIRRANHYARMIDDLNLSILSGKTPRYPADDAYYNMRVIDAVFKSIKTGKAVKLPSLERDTFGK